MNATKTIHAIFICGIFIVLATAGTGYTDDYAKTELLFSQMIEQRLLITNYQCELRMLMNLEKLANLMEGEEKERLLNQIKDSNPDVRLDMTIRYRSPNLSTEYSGTMLNISSKGRSLADDNQLKQIVEMPKGSMGFRMDFGDVDIQSIMMMMNNSQPGMKFGSGFITQEMIGPRAYRAVLEHLLKYYTSVIKPGEQLEGKDMIVVECTRKPELISGNFRNVDLPLYPKFILWVNTENLLINKIQILDEENSAIITTRLKDFRFKEKFSDSVFNLEFPDDMNIVDMTPLLNILATMKEQQSDTFSGDQQQFAHVIKTLRKKPAMSLDTDLPPLKLKLLGSNDEIDWIPEKDKPVVMVIWSAEQYNAHILVSDLVTLQKIATDQNFTFINILAGNVPDEFRKFVANKLL